MRKFSATLALKPVMTEDGEKDIAGLLTAALAVSVSDPGEAASVASAIGDISTAFGASSGLKVFIHGSPTKAQVIAALEAVIAQVKSSNVYS
jgi:hypothetical protein